MDKKTLLIITLSVILVLLFITVYYEDYRYNTMKDIVSQDCVSKNITNNIIDLTNSLVDEVNNCYDFEQNLSYITKIKT